MLQQAQINVTTSPNWIRFATPGGPKYGRVLSSCVRVLSCVILVPNLNLSNIWGGRQGLSVANSRRNLVLHVFTRGRFQDRFWLPLGFILGSISGSLAFFLGGGGHSYRQMLGPICRAPCTWQYCLRFPKLPSMTTTDPQTSCRASKRERIGAMLRTIDKYVEMIK